MVDGTTVACISCEGLTGIGEAGIGRLVSVGRGVAAALHPASHRKEKINQGTILGDPIHLFTFV